MAAEAGGARGLDLLHRSVLRARAAGIRAEVEFPAPPRQESHRAGDRLAMNAAPVFGERVVPGEALDMAGRETRTEHHEVGEEVGFVGRFGITRFGATRLAP